ncbi:ATP-binding cassette domain-containing protein [Parachlamydia acanthamoebae]|uniref:ATP-binding cassette domain-containing protein n=1 Tax=Parachlamydia acanthamoebae TaxID=83552 RepID=UPI0007515662|nr:ABC transporter transmembrane domain-containing protein [Parachlamydia acanthamoebae]
MQFSIKKFEFLRIEETKLRIYFFLSCLFVLIACGLNIYLPIQAKNIVKLAYGEFSSYEMLSVSFIYAMIWIACQLCLTTREILMIPVSERLISRLSLQTMEHLQALSYEYHSSAQTGELIAKLKKAQIALPNMLWGFFFFTIPPFIEIIGAVCILLIYNFYFCGFILLTTFTVFMVYTVMSAKKAVLFHKRSQSYDGDVNAKLADSLMNFEAVKYFGNEKLEQDNYKKHLENREKAEITSLVFLEKVRIFQFLILGIGFFIITISTAVNIVDKKMNLGDFVLINTYLIQFFNPLSFLAIVFRNIFRGGNDLKLILSIFDVQRPPKASQSLKHFCETIEFKNLSFSYKDTEILKNISFKIHKGEKIGFVGPVGSGKTTIAKLLLKLCDPMKGKVLIDGKEISSIDVNDLKKHIGIIPQNTNIFNDTFLYNLSYGKPDASEEQVKSVAQLLSLESFISQTSQGYNTVIGQQGISLSGGQKQSIGAARLALKNPEIVILDEVTSSLDSHSEARILEYLDHFCRDKTTIIIAHKFSHVMHCDKIFVLNEGHLVEHGNHQTLLALDGVYKKMWDIQVKKVELV